MNPDDWYEDRLLWRARESGLVGKEAVRKFTDLPAGDQAQLWRYCQFAGRPVLLVGNPSTSWVVLTTREVVSCHEGHVSRCELHEHQDFDLGEAKGGQHRKLTSETLRVDGLDGEVTELWCLPGGPILWLWGVMKMFPLSVPEQ